MSFAERCELTSDLKISEFQIASLSKLEYRTYIAEFGGKWSPSALILEFKGIYGNGSMGNGDADFINMVRAGLTTILNVEAVIYDFRNMEYEWGNRIWNVLACPREDGDDAITTAMVISDKCREGFSTCVGMVPPMFDTIEEALAFVEPYARGYLDKLMAE